MSVAYTALKIVAVAPTRERGAQDRGGGERRVRAE
jgi:hypothetical protein